MGDFDEYITIPKVWRSFLDYIPLDGSVVYVRFTNDRGGRETFKCLADNANLLGMNLLKQHPDVEFCPTENVYGYWRVVKNVIPQSSGYYLCKNDKGDLYSVEYFDGNKFSHNENNWVRFWRDLEEKLV